jgi:hypothetical protein
MAGKGDYDQFASTDIQLPDRYALQISVLFGAMAALRG